MIFRFCIVVLLRNWVIQVFILIFTEFSLDVLQKEVKNSMKTALAEGTSKNLKVQWRSYFLFCNFYGLKAIPASLEICVCTHNSWADPLYPWILLGTIFQELKLYISY